MDDSVTTTKRAALEQYLQKNLPLLPPDTSAENYGTEVDDKVYKRVLRERRQLGIWKRLDTKRLKLRMHVRTVTSAAEALQAASKPAEVEASESGEPSRPSLCGWGRPRWHIEFSMLVSEILGKEIE